MQIVNLIQGSPEWHAHRRAHRNASDAPAMMACSPHKHRRELVREKATGVEKEFSQYVQERILDKGHDFERLCRPRAEVIVGDDLSPCVCTNGADSASFDGLSFMGDVSWEHKRLNEALREAMQPGCTGLDLPLCYQVQMEHQCMVGNTIEKVLFTASEWTDDGELIEERHCWYTPNLQLRAQIVAGWEQLEKEVAAYDASAAPAAPVVATPMESLPAVAVKIEGALAVVSNLDKFDAALRAFIERIPSKPATDQEFADTEQACKALKKAEEALESAEEGALAQISDVELMRRTVADLQNLARTTRLAKEKLVTAEKEARRAAIVTDAQTDLDKHVVALNQRLGANWLPRVAGNFGEVIKGKKSLQNMQDAVAVALTNAKADCNTLAQRLESNRTHLRQDDGDWISLFADFATVGAKEPEDFQALAALRIGQHQQAEEKKMEAERARIRAEEEAKAKREADARAAQEAAERDRQLEAERARIRAEEQAKAQADAAEERKRIQVQAQSAKAEIAQAAQTGALGEPVANDLARLATSNAAEAVAGIDAKQVINAAQTSAAAQADESVISIGKINSTLKAGGIDVLVNAGTLDSLGISYRKERGSVLMPESSFPRLCLALAMRLQKLANEYTHQTV